MTNNQNLGLSAAAAFDTQNLDQLKLQAKREPGKAIEKKSTIRIYVDIVLTYRIFAPIVKNTRF